MLSLSEFIAKYTNQPNVGDTPQNQGQCVGLVEVWLDNLGLPHIWGNAIDLLNNADPNYYDIVKNDPNDFNQFPPAGAILVLGQPYGEYVNDAGVMQYAGHTGVIVSADGKTYALFQANNPDGSNPNIGNFQNYNSVIGWIVPKQANATTTQTQPQQQGTFVDKDTFTSLVKKSTEDDAFHAAGFNSPDDVKATIASLTQARDNNATSYQTEVNKNAELTEQSQKLQAQIVELEGQVKTANDTNTGLQKNISEVQARSSSLADQISQMEKADSTAIDEGVKATNSLKATTADVNTIAGALNTTYPDVKNILIEIDNLKNAQQYLYALADQLGIVRTGLSDKDIYTKCKADIEGIDIVLNQNQQQSFFDNLKKGLKEVLAIFH